MALIRCPECSKEVSDKAPNCPHCGLPLNLESPKITPPTSTKATSTPGASSKPPGEIPIVGIIAVILGAASALMPYFAAVFLVPTAFIGGAVAIFKKQRKLGAAAIILALIGLAGVFVVGEKINKISAVFENPQSTSVITTANEDNSPVVSLADYNAITEGMSYAEVKNIIDSPGVELSRSDVAGYSTVLYAWQNEDGSNMNAMFQNGSLVTKAQFGLR